MAVSAHQAVQSVNPTQLQRAFVCAAATCRELQHVASDAPSTPYGFRAPGPSWAAVQQMRQGDAATILSQSFVPGGWAAFTGLDCNPGLQDNCAGRFSSLPLMSICDPAVVVLPCCRRAVKRGRGSRMRGKGGPYQDVSLQSGGTGHLHCRQPSSE